LLIIFENSSEPHEIVNWCNMIKLRVMTWNIGFGSRKSEFISSDANRAKEILDVVNTLNVDAVALQEMVNREYSDNFPSFNLTKYLIDNDDKLSSIHFEPTVSLGRRHCYPYGKLPEIKKKIKIKWQENGPGIWIRNINNWQLRNLYSDDVIQQAAIEVQRPLPHPLYMGEQPAPVGMEDKPEYSAGRDEEDRPVLWSRIEKINVQLLNLKIYFVSLHLPTLNGEEKGYPRGNFNKSQKNIFHNVLRLSAEILGDYTVDDLAFEYRQYFLNNIISQVKRIEEYWEAEDGENRCIFILAGDFNFYHTTSTNPKKTGEQILLENNDFKRAKLDGTTRPGDRLIDNIWVKGAKTVSEWKDKGKSIDEISKYIQRLKKISDHYPVIAEIGF
jgi:endonuclease/exonuclease/phosphatase family metal-dependent hydrolase